MLTAAAYRGQLFVVCTKNEGDSICSHMGYSRHAPVENALNPEVMGLANFSASPDISLADQKENLFYELAIFLRSGNSNDSGGVKLFETKSNYMDASTLFEGQTKTYKDIHNVTKYVISPQFLVVVDGAVWSAQKLPSKNMVRRVKLTRVGCSDIMAWGVGSAMFARLVEKMAMPPEEILAVIVQRMAAENKIDLGKVIVYTLGKSVDPQDRAYFHKPLTV